MRDTAGPSALNIGALDFEKGGGVVVVVTQDAVSGSVLMVAHADREALEQTIATGEMHYRSRSRGLWRKGETSGNVQRVVSLSMDCDGDAVLARVVPTGPACHAGSTSCFGEDATAADALGQLDLTIGERATGTEKTAEADPGNATSYTQRLLADRNLRLKKLGEETSELVVACADGDRTRAAEECADVLYHLLVAIRAVGLSLNDARAVLARRAEAGVSGS